MLSETLALEGPGRPVLLDREAIFFLQPISIAGVPFILDQVNAQFSWLVSGSAFPLEICRKKFVYLVFSPGRDGTAFVPQ